MARSCPAWIIRRIFRPEVANRHSGYQVGGTSPFATKRPMAVYLEKTVLALPRVYVNGGSRGFLVGLAPADLAKLLSPIFVEVAIAPRS